MSDSAPADDRTNPKDRVGRLKVDLSLFPPAAHIHGAHAFMDGARKYGPFNWRERSVSARVYVSAAMRHLADFLDGEDVAADSGAHHLGHGIACLAIILDALETGNLIDDRPAKGAAPAVLDRLNAAIVEREAARLDAEGALVVKTPEPPEGATAPGVDPVVIAGVDLQADQAVVLVRSFLSGKLKGEIHTFRHISDEVDLFPASGDDDPLALTLTETATLDALGCTCLPGKVCKRSINANCPRLDR